MKSLRVIIFFSHSTIQELTDWYGFN